MENIILTIHLILALLLIGVVLLQRSEGGGLGMGSSSSGGGVMTGRQAANALTKATWVLAALFLATSVTLTVLATRGQGSGSILDRLAPTSGATTGSVPTPDVELPPPAAADAPIAPPAADAPTTPPASN